MNCFKPVQENKLCRNQSFIGDELYQYAVLCDFDGTISEKDVTDTLLEHFGGESCAYLERQWQDGIIGSRDCMRQQIASMNASLLELDSVLRQIRIDPTFVSFVDFAQCRHINIHIVSDGLDYAIQSVLKQNKLDYIPVFANQLLHDFERSWKLEFPYADAHCVKASGNCKCRHRHQLSGFRKVFYVGDGTSDFCVVDKVDLVFAKDKLIDFCQQRSIPFYPIDSFGDVVAALPNLIKAESVFC